MIRVFCDRDMPDDWRPTPATVYVNPLDVPRVDPIPEPAPLPWREPPTEVRVPEFMRTFEPSARVRAFLGAKP